MDELDEITKSFDDELRTKALTVVREQLSQCVQSSEKNRAELISRLAEFVDTEVASFHTKEDKLIKWFETRYSDHIHLVRQEADKQLEALKTVCHVNATLTAEDKAENRVTVTAEPARPVDNSSGAEPVPNLGNGTSKKRSRDRKRNKHGAAPKRVRGLTDDEQREVFLEALKTRAPFQAAEMYGKAYAFELPKGSRQICVIYCAECEYFFDRSFEKYSNLVSNHWLLTNVHRHVWQRLRVCPLMMEDILERHTYRVVGADVEWAIKNNDELLAKSKTAQASRKKSNYQARAQPAFVPEAPGEHDAEFQPPPRPCIPCITRHRKCDRRTPCGGCILADVDCVTHTNDPQKRSTRVPARPNAYNVGEEENDNDSEKEGDESILSDLSYLSEDDDAILALNSSNENDENDKGEQGGSSGTENDDLIFINERRHLRWVDIHESSRVQDGLHHEFKTEAPEEE